MAQTSWSAAGGFGVAGDAGQFASASRQSMPSQDAQSFFQVARAAAVKSYDSAACRSRYQNVWRRNGPLVLKYIKCSFE